MNELQRRISVMQAFEDGEAIESAALNSGKSYQPNMTPLWNWAEFDYRVAPKKLELWANLYPGGTLSLHGTRQLALDAVADDERSVERVAIHLVEPDE